MTKLIGGNISDTPIKDISDGSAFSVGGGGGRRDLQALGLDLSNAISTAPAGTATNGVYVLSLMFDYDPLNIRNITASHASYSNRRLARMRYEDGGMGGGLSELWWPPGTSIDFDHGNSNMTIQWLDISKPNFAWDGFVDLSYAEITSGAGGDLISAASNTAGANVIYLNYWRTNGGGVNAAGKTLLTNYGDTGNWLCSPFHLPAGQKLNLGEGDGVAFYELL